jgi:hypothetical protein
MPEVWSFIEFVSVLPHILRLRLYLARGYWIIAERYLLDTITSIAYVTDNLSFLKSRTSRMICRFIPEETAFVYLDSDYETIWRRRLPTLAMNHAAKQEFGNRYSKQNYVEPASYIEFQRAAYRILAKSFGALIIDTSKRSIEETSKVIQQYVGLA